MFTHTSRLSVLGLATISGFALVAAPPLHVAGATSLARPAASSAPRSAALPPRHVTTTAGPAAAALVQHAPTMVTPASKPHKASVLAASSPTRLGTSAARVTCVNNPTSDTAALLAALNAGGTLTIGAGTCALDAHLPVNNATTITGAGANATFLVQHTPRTGIFNVKVPHVTIANVNLDTAQANPLSYGSGGGSFAPGVIFSAQSYTSVINVTAEVGDGFGMRITGSNPCSSYPTVGTVVQNVNVTNTGSGGRAAIDIDCTNGATISNITIHGQYIALYMDENVILNGETYTAQSFMGKCHEPWYVTGPAANITIEGVVGGGRGIIAGTITGIVTNLVVTAQASIPGC